MQNSQDKFRLHIGMRNVKTAISATLCALLYGCTRSGASSGYSGCSGADQ